MEENHVPESPTAPEGSAVTEFSVDELTRSNSDSSSLISVNSDDILWGLVTPLERGLDELNRGDSSSTKGRKNYFLMDNCTTWTNEKHNSYLNHLEVSFVKQLNQSMDFLAKCSKQNQSENSVSQKCPRNVHDASDQFEDIICLKSNSCLQKINYERKRPLLHTSTDIHHALVSPCMHRFTQMGKQQPLPSADVQEYMEHCNAAKHIIRRRGSSQGLATSSQQFLASDLNHIGSLEFLTEGTGQNFTDEECQSSHQNNSSQTKRFKRALVDISSHDQIVPCGKSPAVDNSTVDSPAVSENFENFVCPPT